MTATQDFLILSNLYQRISYESMKSYPLKPISKLRLTLQLG